MKPFRSPIATITDNLYLCGIGCITGENLSRRGITHILNTAEELKDFHYPIENCISVQHILLKDTECEDLLRHLDVCADNIHSIEQQNGRILVHCVAGVSRSPSICIAYLIKYRNMTLKKAYYHVMNKRACIYPNIGFWRQLIEYEFQIRGANSVELLPFVLGMMPDVLKNDAEYKIKMAWMKELGSLFGVHMLILILQVISFYVF